MGAGSNGGSRRGADIAALAAQLESVLDKHQEVLEAYLFGSRATGRNLPTSDIDVAVYVDCSRVSDVEFGYGAALGADLMSALGTNRVDLVVLNEAPPVLYHRVLRDGIRLISRDPASTTTREGQALSRYCDFVPQMAKIDKAMRARQPDAKKP